MTETTHDEHDIPVCPPGCMQNNKGHFIPKGKVKDQDLLEDQTVLKIFEYADELSERMKRFKAHCYDDLATLLDLLKENYGVAKGGPKGNVEFTSYDGTKKVRISVSDHIAFGPELQIAKELIDEVLADEAATASETIQAVINQTFNVEKPDKVNREALFSLRKLNVEDERWKKAMEAIADSIRITGSKTYIRIYEREKAEGKFKQVPLNLAAL